eukprot:1152168-Pelagomonas_calceolata.AAC.5
MQLCRCCCCWLPLPACVRPPNAPPSPHSLPLLLPQSTWGCAAALRQVLALKLLSSASGACLVLPPLLLLLLPTGTLGALPLTAAAETTAALRCWLEGLAPSLAVEVAVSRQSRHHTRLCGCARRGPLVAYCSAAALTHPHLSSSGCSAHGAATPRSPPALTGSKGGAQGSAVPGVCCALWLVASQEAIHEQRAHVQGVAAGAEEKVHNTLSGDRHRRGRVLGHKRAGRHRRRNGSSHGIQGPGS